MLVRFLASFPRFLTLLRDRNAVAPKGFAGDFLGFCSSLVFHPHAVVGTFDVVQKIRRISIRKPEALPCNQRLERRAGEPYVIPGALPLYEKFSLNLAAIFN